MEKYITQLTHLFVAYAPRVLGAIVVLVIGLFLIKIIKKSLRKLFEKRKMEPSLSSFLISLIDILLQALLWISILSMVGIAMTSFIAILGAAGLAIGMALTGTLQNFAGGVMILLFRPFRVGDYIESQGIAGVVKEIQIFNTIIKTPDNKTIIVPNANLSNTITTNYSTEPLRRVDISVGIGYGEDIARAEAVLGDIFKQNEKILKDPAPFIGVAELADSSVNLAIRVWTKSADYWDVFFWLNRTIYEEFTRQGISIPYPQLDVHLTKE